MKVVDGFFGFVSDIMKDKQIYVIFHLFDITYDDKSFIVGIIKDNKIYIISPSF